MNDILPEETPVWQYLERTVSQVLHSYGYHQIRMPIVEQTDLFRRSIGEVTDIVEKEMYTFDDRNGDSLTLRPEGTAGCVRAAEEHGLLFNQTRKLWYIGPMFRHERPQKGRYRQFHQIGVECFGMSGPDIDAELLIMTARLWRQLGLDQHVRLEINSIGSAEARHSFREALIEYLTPYREQLDEDSRRRLESNPLRILDTKEPATRAILEDAPTLASFLDKASQEHFDTLCAKLRHTGIDYTVNPALVRGLDYYGKTVFEWVTESLGAQGTVCAGGRYDGLVEQLGGKPNPGVGFAIGLERLVLMLQSLELVPANVSGDADIYLMAMGESAERRVVELSEQLRNRWPDRMVVAHCGGGSFKSQMKKADRSGASFALIMGDNEVESASINLKPLRSNDEQRTVRLSDLPDVLAELLV